MLDVGFQIAQDITVEILASHISGRLRNRGFCVVFEDELERCWPSKKIEPAEREKQIQTFAKSHEWNAFILAVDSGIRAIFQKKEPGDTHSSKSGLKGNGALFESE